LAPAAPQHEALYCSADDPDALLDAIVGWKPPPLGDKWTDRRGVGPSAIGASASPSAPTEPKK
jgi:hypothetical protein